nr:hypothetical protein [Tanacetum cinerariifolium]
KQSNDVTRLQALVDKKKVVVTEATIRDALHLDDAEGVDCLPNEEIFTALDSMGRKFNFSKYIFESLVRNVDSSSKFYMYPRVGKGCSGVKTSLFEGMLVVREPEEQGDAEEQGNDDNVAEEPVTDGRMIDELDKNEGAELINEKEEKEIKEVQDITGNAQVEGRQAEIYQIDMDHAVKVLRMQEDEPEIQEAVEVVTTTKLITKVVAAVSETVSAAAVVHAVVTETVSAAAVIPTAAPVKVVVPSTKRRRKVVIRDPEEESSAKTPTETKSKDKGKGIMVEEPKPMKKKQQVELDEAYARKLQEELNQDIDWEVAIDHVKQKAKENPYVQRYQTMKKRPQTEAQARRNMMMYLKNTAGFRMDYFKGMSYDDIRPIFKAKFNSNIEFLLKTKEQIEEEDNIAIAIINETPAQKAAKRRRLNEEAKDVEELKQHLKIVPDEDDDVYTEATPLARKVPVVDYQIVHFNNKPHYKIIRADETHQLYVSFITLLKNFDREDLESLPDEKDQVWMNQRSVHAQAKVKSWNLLESCGVHIVALTTTHLIMLVERRYPLSSFGVDAAIEIKEKHQVFTAASEDISAVRQKLMLLVTAVK